MYEKIELGQKMKFFKIFILKNLGYDTNKQKQMKILKNKIFTKKNTKIMSYIFYIFHTNIYIYYYEYTLQRCVLISFSAYQQQKI